MAFVPIPGVSPSPFTSTLTILPPSVVTVTDTSPPNPSAAPVNVSLPDVATSSLPASIPFPTANIA